MLAGMTPSFATAPPLTTDDAVLERVEQLVGPAIVPRRLWVMFVDGDQRQAPVMMPIDDIPPRPDRTVEGLGAVLAGFVPDLATDTGPGSVVFVLERLGDERVTSADRAWVQALTKACGDVRVAARGVYRSTPDGVRRLA
jgi:hypothetical protein